MLLLDAIKVDVARVQNVTVFFPTYAKFSPDVLSLGNGLMPPDLSGALHGVNQGLGGFGLGAPRMPDHAELSVHFQCYIQAF